MFKQGRSVAMLPAVRVESIHYYVSLLTATGVKCSAQWDNDDAGRRADEKATETFGEAFAGNHFYLLPLESRRAKNRIMQDLFEGADLSMIRRQLGLRANSAFQKTIASLFYDPRKTEVIN